MWVHLQLFLTLEYRIARPRSIAHDQGRNAEMGISVRPTARCAAPPTLAQGYSTINPRV
jgi:hypothetical protein